MWVISSGRSWRRRKSTNGDQSSGMRNRFVGGYRKLYPETSFRGWEKYRSGVPLQGIGGSEARRTPKITREAQRPPERQNDRMPPASRGPLGRQKSPHRKIPLSPTEIKLTVPHRLRLAKRNSSANWACSISHKEYCLADGPIR